MPTSSYHNKVYSKAYGKSYAAIGEFIFRFESLLEFIRQAIINCALKEGIRNEKIIEILLYDSTGKPLLDYFKACIYELYPEQMQDKQINTYMKSIFEGIKTAYEKRNELAHSNYYHDYIFPEENKKKYGYKIEVYATKPKVYKDGMKENIITLDFKELKKINKDLMDLGVKIRSVSDNILRYNCRLDRPMALRKMWKKDFYSNAIAEKREEERKVKNDVSNSEIIKESFWVTITDPEKDDDKIPF